MELTDPRRRRRLLALAALACVALAALALRGWIGAQARAVTVLATTLETPGLARVVLAVTDAPALSEERVAGVEATVARPAGHPPWPAIVFVNGATVEGRRHPTVRRLAEGLARAGYLVVVPDLPGLQDGALDERTVAATQEVARVASELPDARGRVGLVGVSTGATLALLAAEAPALAGRVSVVAGVAPFSDVREVVRIATTGTYRGDGRLEREVADPFLLEVVARSLAEAVSAGAQREALLAALGAARDGKQPFPADLGAEARGVATLLRNREPRRFDALYTALAPAVRARLERLSPLAGRGRITAPVELASGPQDKFFPVAESRAVGRIAPRLNVTVTAALDHADLVPTLGDLPDLARLDGFVVRALRFASK